MTPVIFRYITLQHNSFGLSKREVSAVTKEPDEFDPGSEKPGFLWNELWALIETLQDLHLQISSRLLEQRVHPPAHSGADREQGLNISQALKEYVETNTDEQTRSNDVGSNSSHAVSDTGAEAAPSDIPSLADSPLGARCHPNELSGYLKDHAGGQEVARHMGEKMRATTLEHLNKTVQLARQGDRKGAYFHAELADNAMRLAREHMSSQDYEEFQEAVRERMNAVKSETPPNLARR